MKIFLDTAHIEAIKTYAQTGLINGVTTNPTHLSKEGGDPKQQVLEICSILKHGEVSVEVTEQEPHKVYEQAHAIAKLAKNIVVKVPCHADYYGIIHKLVQEGIALNITLVFSLLQSAMMCKLGVRYISPFVGRLDDNKEDGSQLLFDIRHMVDCYGFETQILAASMRHAQHIHNAIMAGADAITMPPALFQEINTHVLTDRGMAQFNADWQKLGIKQFP